MKAADADGDAGSPARSKRQSLPSVSISPVLSHSEWRSAKRSPSLHDLSPWSSASASSTPTRSSFGEVRKRIDYSSAESVWAALVPDSGIEVLSANWLLALAQTYGVAGYRNKKGPVAIIPRWQDCPREAFLSAEDLRKIYDEAPNEDTPWGPCPKPPGEQKRLPLISMSLMWHSEDHPDPEGESLCTIGLALRRYLPNFKKMGYKDMGVYLDWCSVPQVPRTLQDTLLYNRSKRHFALFFAHPLITVWMLPELPEEEPDAPPYFERVSRTTGWLGHGMAWARMDWGLNGLGLEWTGA